MTQRDLLLRLRADSVRLKDQYTDAGSNREAAGVARVIELIDNALCVIPPLITEPSPDMDTGGAG